MWSPGGISTHPTKHNPVDFEHSVAYDETMTNCLKECEPDHVNTSLYCGKGRWPWSMKFYNSLPDSNYYDYDYILPQEDAGLSRRRNNENEWNPS
ncbi:unnamed protein product [Rotaria socialis]|uniref:Uncharacterized protein n=1 Tax=Rotaria socialis TaxID=392032 RepID=A0A818K1D6_9BILA|nr:unnamed protein product [Rotaria socialis]CAF4570871.1 unnamed protein product [Rotaria socialis]